MSDPALISFIVKEIALEGNYGCSIPKLFEFAESFHSQVPQRRIALDSLFSQDFTDDFEEFESVPERKAEFFTPAPLDDGRKNEIWEALKANPDIRIGRLDDGRNMSFEEIVADDAVRRKRREDANMDDGDNDLPPQHPVEELPPGEKKKKIKKFSPKEIPMADTEIWKLYASEERVWHALTGHGVDYKKCPNAAFELLKEIGRVRKLGILQPDLSKVCEQDPRSVATRTKLLAELGYIEKKSVLASKMRTSKLTLKSFVEEAEDGGVFVKAKSEIDRNREVVDVKSFLRIIFDSLRTAKSNVLLRYDLKRKMKMDEEVLRYRAFNRLIRKLEVDGYIKRINVPVRVPRLPKIVKGPSGKKMRKEVGGFVERMSKCVQMVKDMSTEEEFDEYLKLSRSTVNQDVEGEEEEEEDEDDAEIAAARKDNELDMVNQITDAIAQKKEKSSGLYPLWKLGEPMEALLSEKIEAAGTEGISSMVLHDTSTGRHFYRPLDQVLFRLTRSVQYQQPWYLQHKAIVRESDISGRTYHYRYFTVESHKKLVDEGIAEPLKETPPTAAQTLRIQKAALIVGQHDGLGFPVYDTDAFLFKDKIGTVTEAQRRIRLIEDRRHILGQCRVARKKDGSLYLDWSSMKTYGNREIYERNVTPEEFASITYQAIKIAQHRCLPKAIGLELKNKYPKLKSLRNKLDENGQPRKLGRPRKPDSELKRPRKKIKPIAEDKEKVESLKRKAEDPATHVEGDSVEPPAKKPRGRPRKNTESTPTTPKSRAKAKESAPKSKAKNDGSGGPAHPATSADPDDEVVNAAPSTTDNDVMEGIEIMQTSPNTPPRVGVEATSPAKARGRPQRTKIMSSPMKIQPEVEGIHKPPPVTTVSTPTNSERKMSGIKEQVIKDAVEYVETTEGPGPEPKPETPTPRKRGRPPKKKAAPKATPNGGIKAFTTPTTPASTTSISKPTTPVTSRKQSELKASVIAEGGPIPTLATPSTPIPAVNTTSTDSRAAKSQKGQSLIDKFLQVTPRSSPRLNRQPQNEVSQMEVTSASLENAQAAIRRSPRKASGGVNGKAVEASPLREASNSTSNVDNLLPTPARKRRQTSLAENSGSPTRPRKRVQFENIGEEQSKNPLSKAVDLLPTDASLRVSVDDNALAAYQLLKDTCAAGEVSDEPAAEDSSAISSEGDVVMDDANEKPSKDVVAKGPSSQLASEMDIEMTDVGATNVRTVDEDRPERPNEEGIAEKNVGIALSPRKAGLEKVTIEKVQPTVADTEAAKRYGASGGMVNLWRRQVVQELLEEHGGVFPGGMELRHAFAEKFKERNANAGVPDRRLISNVINSLYSQGYLYEVCVNMTTKKGTPVKKRILIKQGIPMDDPAVTRMKECMFEADGGLWFPPGTKIPKELEDRMKGPVVRNPETGSRQAKPPLERVDLDIFYTPPSIEKYQQKVAQLEPYVAPRKKPHKKNAEAERLLHEAKTRRRIQLYGESDEALALSGEMEGSRSNKEIDYLFHDDKIDKKGKLWWARFDKDEDELPREDADDDLFPASVSQRILQASKENKLLAPYIPTSPKTEDDVIAGIDNVKHWEVYSEIFPERMWDPLRDKQIPKGYIGGYFIHQSTPASKCPNFKQETVDFSIQKMKRARITTPEPEDKMAKPRGNNGQMWQVKEGEPYQIIFTKKRLCGPRKKDKAMRAIHTGNFAEEEDLTLPPTREFQNRRKVIFTKEDDEFLIYATSIIRVLYGGTERRINWEKMADTMESDEHDVPTIKAHWPRLRMVHKDRILQLMKDFEDLYLEGYEAGLLPDFESDINKFDLPWHTQWFRDKVEVYDSSSGPHLPASFAEFNRFFKLEPHPSSQNSLNTEYFNPMVANTIRFQTMCSVPYVIETGEEKEDAPVDPEREKAITDAQLMIKSNLTTEAAAYNGINAAEKLKAIPQDILPIANSRLLADKVMAERKGTKIVPGRQFELTDLFHSSLNKGVPIRVLRGAVAAERDLYQRLVFNGEEQIELDPLNIRDGTVLALINLLSERAVVVKRLDYKAEAGGLISGYKTRLMDKDLVNFKLAVSLRQDTVAKRLTPLDTPEKPAFKNTYRAWFDINKNLIDGMWQLVRGSVLNAVLFREGITTNQVSEILRPGLLRVEVEEVIEWLVKRGALLRDEKGHLSTQEGWWRGVA